LSIEPTGRFAYLANFASNVITSYAINEMTGELTEVGTPQPAGVGPVSIAIDPSGQRMYVANRTSDDVLIFRIDSVSEPPDHYLTWLGNGKASLRHRAMRS
jgi:6-phosphogluconolactonase (cycloisomerase 2 family)